MWLTEAQGGVVRVSSEEAAKTGEEIPAIYRSRMQVVMQRQAKAQQSRYSGWGKN